MAVSRAIDVTALINARGVGMSHIKLILWCVTLLLWDGYDFAAIGNIAPSVIADWHIDRAAFGPVFAINAFGLMTGALLFGPIADRVGRRLAIVAGGLCFGIFTLASAWSTDVPELLVLRFLAGIGLGGVNPNVIAFVAEYVPERRRAITITLTVIGFTGGTALGGVIAAKLLAWFGWHAVLYLGGIAPILTSLLLLYVLPESIKMLCLLPGRGAEIAAALKRLFPDGDFPPDAHYYVTEHEPRGVKLISLFGKRYFGTTATLWAGQFLNQIVILFLVSWLPILMTGAGISVEDAVIASAMVPVGGVIGGLVFSPLLDRFGPLSVAAGFILAIPAVASLGWAGSSATLVGALAFGAGFCVIGTQFGQTALLGILYPTAIRATGAGWAIGMGRWGAVVGPGVATIFIARHLPLASLFAVAAIPEAGAAAAFIIYAWPRHNAAKSS